MTYDWPGLAHHHTIQGLIWPPDVHATVSQNKRGLSQYHELKTDQ